MEKLLDKLSSYSIVNNLIPGALFVCLFKLFIGEQLPLESAIEKVFAYYCCGMIINRIGSLIIEPICAKLRIVKYAPKAEYITATKKDKLIETLLETNNLYRTCAGMALMLLICKLYSCVAQFLLIPVTITWWVIIVLLLVLFIVSYRKQTKHIVSRVVAANENTRQDVGGD